MDIVIANAQRKVETMSETEKSQLDKLLDISPFEMVIYQNIKSIAYMEGKISPEVAQFVYQRLGNWSETKLEVKVVLTQLFARFLGQK